MQNPFEIIASRLSTIEALLIDIKHQPPAPASPSVAPLPIFSKKQVMEMTGWPPGTLNQKIAEMPEGVVIKGRSRRNCFDREKFLEWLKTPA